MPTYRRKQIVETFIARLQAVKKINGYATDAGLHLFQGPTILGPDDPPLGIAIVVGDSVPDMQQNQKIILLPIELHALAKDDVTDPLLATEDLIGDIKRAVESPETAKRDLGGLALKLDAGDVAALPRPEGSTTVGARVTYVVEYAETWGDPAA